MAKSPVARSLGPLETIVNVGWGAGVYIVVSANGIYTEGAAGSRHGNVILTADGVKNGGRIIVQETFQGPPVPGAPHGTFLHTAVLRFARVPTSGIIPKGPDFAINLSGAITVTDPTQPGSLVRLFCGTKTTTVTTGPIYVGSPATEDRGPIFLRDTTIDEVSPKGHSSATFVSVPLATIEWKDVGTGGGQSVDVSDTIWYEDQYGNLIDTFRSCTQLPPPDDAVPVPASRIEGFAGIECAVYPVSGSKVNLNPSDWAENPIITGTKFGGPAWTAGSGRIQSGLNSDNNPIFDDLPDGSYTYKLDRVAFVNLPTAKKAPIAYPHDPGFVKYGYAVGTPTPYHLHAAATEMPGGIPPNLGETFP